MNKYAKLDLGTVEAVFNKLGGMEGAQAFLRGETKLVVKPHLIDCDAVPFCQFGTSIVEHKQGGKFEWKSDQVELYLSNQQLGGKHISGYQLQKELEGKPVLNAVVLDWLLEHPKLIPGAWKGRYIYFWGTIFQIPDEGHCVRCLYWSDGLWCRQNVWIGCDFGSKSAVAILLK